MLSPKTTGTESIQITPAEAGRLKIVLPYHPGRIAKIKRVEGRRWHAEGRYWTVLRTDDTLSHLLTLFMGEYLDVEASLHSGIRSNAEHKAEAREAIASNLAVVDRVRLAIRVRHYSHRTEKTYVGWIRRFLLFHRDQDPTTMSEEAVGHVLSSLAIDRRVSASTQNQALNAIVFLYRDVLEKEIGYVGGVMRAKRPTRLPVVLTKEEVRMILTHLHGTEWIMTMLLYGAGLRLMECLRLRIKDIDFARNEIRLRAGKGDKDRVTMLPATVKDSLRQHLEQVKAQFETDTRNGYDGVSLPNALV